MKFVKGPDFPTGGLVYRHKNNLKADHDTMVSAYATGRGKITVRAKVYIEDIGRGKSQIIVSELPYQANKSTIIERIASYAQKGKLEGLADLRDESDRQGMRIVIELQRGVQPNDVLSDLFKLTPLQETFSINMLALVDGQPKVLGLKQSIKVYLDHRQEIVKRRSEYDLTKAKDRAHILEGLLEALDNLDEAIAIIRKSRRVDTARKNLMKALKVTEVQAQAILDMQLRRLAALERKKITDEYDELIKKIDYLEGLLRSPEQMRDVIADELREIKTTYNDPRRTIIVDETATNKVKAKDFVLPEEDTWITVTVDGNVARLRDTDAPRVTTTDKEPPRFIMDASTNQILYLFTTDGEAATVPVQQITPVDEMTEGTHFSALTGLDPNVELAAAVCLPAGGKTGYLFLATDGDQVKRVRVQDLPGVTSKVFTVMNVGDEQLKFVFPTAGTDDIMLTTKHGYAIRFDEDEVRATGLPAGGVRGIKMQDEDDGIVGAFVVIENQYDNQWVWNITDDGIAKISNALEYPTQGRAGQGVITMRVPELSEGVVAAAIGKQDDNVIVLTNKNKPKYMRIGLAEEVQRGRAGFNESVISMRDNEHVVSVATYQPRVILPEPAADDGEPEPAA